MHNQTISIEVQAAGDRLFSHFEDAGFVVKPIKDIQNGSIIAISRPGHNEAVRVNVYRGKRGTTCVWLMTEQPLARDLMCFLSSLNLAKGLRKPCIGTDESGKGDFFGPLVVAGFLSDRNTEAVLMHNHIKDSKLLTDDQIRQTAAWLTTQYPERIAVVCCQPEDYNRLYSEFRLNGKNMNHLLASLHAQVITRMVKLAAQRQIQVADACSDQFGSVLLIEEELVRTGQTIHLIQAFHAESHPFVAAASIIARNYFLTWMEQKAAEVGTFLPKGAGEEARMTAVCIVRQRGSDMLKSLCKLHFRTTRTVLDDISDAYKTGGRLLREDRQC